LKLAWRWKWYGGDKMRVVMETRNGKNEEKMKKK
jgi:hypothetical protein